MPRVDPSSYLMYPWSIRGPRMVTDEFGNKHFELRISELPDFFVAASTESEALYELKPALLAFLESYVAEGETPPLPKGVPARLVPFSFVRRSSQVQLAPSSSTASSAREPLALV
jgi:predicted RNase H-like HicB family nuclease